MIQTWIRPRSAVAASLALLLIGCGGEGEKTSPPPVTPGGGDNAPLLAIDGFSVVTPAESTRIDMSQFVRGSNARITHVNELRDNAACGKAQIQGLSLNVTAQRGAYCEYAYTVAQSGAGTTTAKLNVLATDAAKPILPPISAALIIGGAAQSFNLQSLLGDKWKSTYSLDADTLAVQGMQGNEGSASATGNSIVFTPPTLSGWSRIVYTLNDSAAPESSVVGVIYVTVSEVINRAPNIVPTSYTYSPTTQVLMGDEVTLDLSTLTGLDITEPDKQDWQLISVQSFSASVASAAPNSVTNKAFTFRAATLGEHFVSYIIADHYGGYATGLIKIDVKAKGGVPTWTGITQGALRFTAPLTYTQSQSSALKTQGVWEEGVNNTIAGFTQKSATQYCASLGSLPLRKNFEALRAANVSGNALTGELAKWPKLKPYLVFDGNAYKGIQLPAGTGSRYDPAESYYVTCLENHDFSLTMLAYTVVANGAEVPVARVNTLGVEDTFTLAKVGGSLSEADVDIVVGSVEGNQSTLVASSLKAGDYRFSVTSDGVVVESGILKFIPDATTVEAHITVVVPTAPINYLQDTSDEAKVVFRYADANDNAVANRLVAIASDSSTARYRTEPSSGLTDETGSLSVYVKNKVKEAVTLTPTLSLNGSRAVGETAEVSFVNQFPCQGGGFNCLPVVSETAIPGKLYTPAPERSFLESLVVSQTGYNEGDGTSGPEGYHGALVNWLEAGSWCNTLSLMKHADRTNWTMATREELKGVNTQLGNMFSTHGWPTGRDYWTKTATDSSYWRVDLRDGTEDKFAPNLQAFASCVSNPPADLGTVDFDRNTGLVVNKRTAAPDGAEFVQLTATLTDRYGFVAEGIQVIAEITESGSGANSAVVEVPAGGTDKKGQAVIRIRNTEQGTLTVTAKASLPGGRKIESVPKTVEFVLPWVSVATDRYPCPAGGFTCIPTVTIGKTQFSGPHEVRILDDMRIEYEESSIGVGNGTPGKPIGLKMGFVKYRDVAQYCAALNRVGFLAGGGGEWRIPSQAEIRKLYAAYPYTPGFGSVYGNLVDRLNWLAYSDRPFYIEANPTWIGQKQFGGYMWETEQVDVDLQTKDVDATMSCARTIN